VNSSWSPNITRTFPAGFRSKSFKALIYVFV
jgi:hypothetical protein